MEKNIYRYIIKYSTPQQIVLTLMAVASFPFLYAFYELPKQIVNEAIQANSVVFPVELAGLEFDQIDYLMLLSGGFLLLVAVNQTFKYIINVYRGRTGERMLRRLRFDLYARVLRFPLPQFRKTSQGEVVQMVTAEVEPLGGFVGDAFSLPAFQGGTLLVILSFLLLQNWVMALAAIALYPLQFWLIPKLQRRVNTLGKERVRRVRRLSDKIGESISGVQEIHANDTAALERAEFSSQLGGIFEVRLRIYIWKFIIKFVNNTINQLGPFCFYSIGGYLVIEGQLEIGTLMAAIAAHKDLAAPWKELLNYYQRKEDARIKFEQVIEQFGPPGIMEEDQQMGDPTADEMGPLTGEVSGSNVTLQDDTGTVMVDGASFSFQANEHVALVGGTGSGKEELAQLISRLQVATGGTLTVGGARMSDMKEAVAGRRIGYVGPGAYLFSTSVRDNLVYGLKHRPIVERPRDEAEEKQHAYALGEALAAGNSEHDIEADWVDFEAAGAASRDALDARLFEILEMVGLEQAVYEFGLRSAINPDEQPELAERLLQARQAFQQRLADPDIARLVETFDSAKYNDNATLGENLLFGTPVGDTFDVDRLAENAYVHEVLQATQLAEPLLETGREVAATMVELFADLAPGHEFFEQYSFISSDDLPDFQALLQRISRDGMESLKEEERNRILSLSFKLSPARHRLGVVDDELRNRILEARTLFRDDLPPDQKDAIEFFDEQKYNAAATIQDNILFGKMAYGQAQGAEQVGVLIAEVVDEQTLRHDVMAAGLNFQVGIGGGRLSAANRQKLAIARGVVKRPDLLVMNEATASLDSASQRLILDCLLSEFDGRGIVWALHRAADAERFDRIIVLSGGKVVEQGTYEELNRDGSALRALLDAD